jgi:hypothetical protein
MKTAMIACAALLTMAAAPVLAARSWSGFLVSSDCYAAEERNVNPTDTETYVNRDRDFEVRYCSPNAKTKSFTLVDHDGLSYTLDAAGNAKAAEIVRRTGKKRLLEVSVIGEAGENVIQVTSISTAK